MQVKNTQQNDDIDLRELIRKLLKRKKLILSITTSIFLIALIYALFATPVYKAKVAYLPPTLADVAALNYPGAGTEVDPLTIYTQFEKNLNSVELRKQTFYKSSLFQAEQSQNSDIMQLFNQINENLSISKPPIKKGETPVPAIYLSLTGSEPRLLAETLNQLDTVVRNTTKDEVIRNTLEQIKLQKEQLEREIRELRLKAEKQKQDTITQLREADKIEKNKIIDQINTLRASAKTKRLDHALALEEAAKVAESIGLAEKSSLLESNQANDKTSFYTEVNTQAQPLYLRGYKALRSEIKELKERQSDDPFIPGLRDLQDKLDLLSTNRQVDALLERQSNDPFIEGLRDKELAFNLLNTFQINPEQIKVAILDQAAFPPEKREKPKRSLIVVQGVVGGLIIGILAAFLANFWQSLRLEDEGKA